MWEEIGAAAIYGAIGGGVGALIGGLLAYPFRKTGIGKILTTILTVAGAVLGYNFAEPILKPYIGAYVDALVGSSDEKRVEEALQTLREDPMMGALMEREPGFEEEARAVFADALRSRNQKDAKQKAYDWGRNVGMSRLPHYMARGRDEDILAFTNLFVDAVDALQSISPPVCYRWTFGGFGSVSGDSEALDKALGGEGIRKQSEILGRLIRNSSDDIPAYDEAAAQAVIEEAGKALYDRLGPDRMAFISGGKQATDPEDQAAVCGAMGAMFRDILARENAADALRHLYRQAG